MVKLKEVLLLCSLALFSGCAAINMQAPSPATQAPKANEGIVVVSVTGNTAEVNQFNDLVLIQQQKDAQKSGPAVQYTLTQSSRGLARDTSVFVGVIPAGEYSFDRFSDPTTRKYLQLSDRGRDLLGTFTVRAGALSDLGRIIVTPINFGIFVGRSSIANSNKELIARFVPDVKKYYDGEVNTGWSQPRSHADIAEQYALTHPVGAAGLVEVADGEVAAASRMGTVLLRSASGRWHRVGGNHLESLLWIKPYHNGNSRLLAVGEFNTLLRMDRNEKLHAMDTGDLPPGNLIFIDGNNSVGWFIAHVRGNDVSVYRSASLEAPKWELLRSEKIGTSFWHGFDNFWIFPTSRGFAYAVSKGDIYVYDYATGGWSHHHAPNDNRLIRIERSPGDVWGILTSPGGGFGGIFSSTYYTRDFGQTWTETKSPYSVKVSTPKITPAGTLLETGGVFGKTGIQGSKDGGKTWNQIAEKSLLRETLWVLPTSGLFLVDDGNLGIGSIEHSGDEGATWDLEFSTFEKAIYDAQKKK